MDEYIERRAAHDAVVDAIWHGKRSMYSVAGAINSVPTADVAPVRHARWVDNHCTECGMMPMGDEMWKHCDFDPPLFEKFMDYCPSCGAKMDLEVQDGKRRSNSDS